METLETTDQATPSAAPIDERERDGIREPSEGAPVPWWRRVFWGGRS